MSLAGDHAQFSRLRESHPAWRLLSAQNAALVLSTLADVFRDSTEVPMARAKVALETELARLREAGGNYQESSSSYWRQWIDAGWLREQDSQLSLTDAAESALRFARGLEQRVSGASASHLRIVQDAVRDLSVALSPDASTRIEALSAQRDALQAQIDTLQGGTVVTLSDEEQRERLHEVYQLATLLTGDFRRLEDDIRHIDQQLRVDMLQDDATRGSVLEKLLGQEDLLARTEAGRAFEGFFQLLADDNRTTEFREQLRAILDLSIAEALKPRQRQFLARLVRELNRESDRVLKVRRRATENLRAYLESSEFQENRAVSRLLHQLEHAAVGLREQHIPNRRELNLSLNSGSPSLQSISSIRLRLPEEELELGDLQVQQRDSTPSELVLDHLETIKVMEIAGAMKLLLQSQGSLSIGQMMQQRPVQGGLEELVAFLRVAQAVKAPSTAQTESVIVQTREGSRLRAKIPSYLLSADMFPPHLEELAL